MFYLHETTDLHPTATDEFAEAFSTEYRPLMEHIGARLVSLWETVPFAHHWPRTIALWEIDDMATLADLGRAQRQDERRAARFRRWQAAIAPMVRSGEGRLLTPSPHSPTLAQLRERGVSSSVCVHETIVTIPGQQFAYVRHLEHLYIPWAERNGRRWLGTYTTNWKNTEAILIWAWERGWDTLVEHYGRQQHIIEHDPDLHAWMELGISLRQDWHDAVLEAILTS